MKFTDRYILNLKAKDKMYQVRETEGFGVRVLPSGVKIWIFVYTIAGKRRQMNLGDYPDISLGKVKDRLLDVKTALKDGKDPQEVGFEWHKNPERDKREAAKALETDRKNPTVTKLAREYMEKHAKKNKRESSWTEDERLLTINVLPVWGDRKAKDIRKRDVVLLLESYSDRPALTHNVFKLVRKMYNFAVSRDILENTPCLGIKVDEIATIASRDRVLKEPNDNNGVDEILTFWKELEKASMSEEVKRILKLLLVTGQRPGEVAGIHSSEIGVERKEQKDDKGNVIREWSETWWTIPVSRRKVKEKSKNPPQPHRVFLSALALELIGNADGYKFPSPKNGQTDENGVIYCDHINENAVAYAIRRNLKNYKPRRAIKGKVIIMVNVREDRKMKIEHFTPHDLRRTCSTRLAELGYKDEVNDAILGHVKKGVVGIYNRYKYDREKLSAMESWERKLNSIITGKESNIIPIGIGKKAA